MELHACRNCQMINQVIGNQTQKFSILSEENLILHNLLIKARQSLRDLSDKLLRSEEALVAEREHNLRLYLKERADINKVLGREFTSEPNTVKPTKTCNEHKKQEGDILQSVEYINLLQTINELQQKQGTILDMVRNESERHTTLLKEHINQAEEHVSVVLEFNRSLRDDLFIQKKQNINDRNDFLKTVDTLTVANEKYIQEVKRTIVTATTRTADKLTKQAINSMCQQLNEREKLVAMLRRQQILLQGQIEQLHKREKTLKDEHNVAINKLRYRMKYEQEKLAGLEQQRKFDAEGFRNDIKNIRQEIKVLNGKLQKLPQDLCRRKKCEQLLKDAEKVKDNLDAFYFTSKMPTF